jgi:hypothetical protein
MLGRLCLVPGFKVTGITLARSPAITVLASQPLGPHTVLPGPRSFDLVRFWYVAATPLPARAENESADSCESLRAH